MISRTITGIQGIRALRSVFEAVECLRRIAIFTAPANMGIRSAIPYTMHIVPKGALQIIKGTDTTSKRAHTNISPSI